MKKIILRSIIIVLLFLQSCLPFVAKKLQLDAKNPSIEKLQINEKEVYFMGMSHLAKKEFYDNTKLLVKEFQSKGFVFYVEAITELDKTKFILDTFYAKKFRKLTEIDLTIRYSMSENLLLQKLKTKYNLIDQPKYDSFGMKNFKRVDFNYTELVDGYENKFEKIVLDSCDLRTDIGKPYNCQKSSLLKRMNFRNELVFKSRNKLITDSILNSNDKRIVIVYGRRHLDGIKEILVNQK